MKKFLNKKKQIQKESGMRKENGFQLGFLKAKPFFQSSSGPFVL